MSTAMGTELVAGSIDASLAEIDSRSRSPSRRCAGDIVVGPFGVLNFEMPSTERSATGGQPDPSQGPTVTATPVSADIAPTNLVATVATEFPVASPGLSALDSLAYMDDFLHWSDLLGLNPDKSGVSLSLDAGETFDFNLPPETSSPEGRVRNVPLFPVNQHHGHVRTSPPGPGAADQMPTPHHTPMKDTSTALNSLEDAPFLFKHFQDNVIPQMMAVPLGEKSPWKILNLPTAIVTYSDITFLGTRTTSHARLANLYGLMACSSIHLTLEPIRDLDKPVEYWRRIAERTYQQAKDHMQISLQCETREPKKAKYKDQLMAICGLIQFAVRNLQLITTYHEF
jgi:arginine metabolism regulation protein II